MKCVGVETARARGVLNLPSVQEDGVACAWGSPGGVGARLRAFCLVCVRCEVVMRAPGLADVRSTDRAAGTRVVCNDLFNYFLAPFLTCVSTDA